MVTAVDVDWILGDMYPPASGNHVVVGWVVDEVAACVSPSHAELGHCQLAPKMPENQGRCCKRYRASRCLSPPPSRASGLGEDPVHEFLSSGAWCDLEQPGDTRQTIDQKAHEAAMCLGLVSTTTTATDGAFEPSPEEHPVGPPSPISLDVGCKGTQPSAYGLNRLSWESMTELLGEGAPLPATVATSSTQPQLVASSTTRLAVPGLVGRIGAQTPKGLKRTASMEFA